LQVTYTEFAIFWHRILTTLIIIIIVVVVVIIINISILFVLVL